MRKIVVIILALLAVLAITFLVLFYLHPKTPTSNRTQVPNEFITSSQNLTKYYSQFNNMEEVKYSTNQSEADLIKYFTNKLSRDGWQIKVSKQLNPSLYNIYANNSAYRINVFIIQIPNQDKRAVDAAYLPLQAKK